MPGSRLQQFTPFIRSRIEQGLQANFIKELGIWATFVDKGHVEFALKVRPPLYQHHSFVHGGVVTTLADHTAGCAAITVAKE